MQNDNFFTVINGVTYSYNQYVQMRQTLTNYEKANYNQPNVMVNNQYGSQTSYLAYWGFYVRLTGREADRTADDIAITGGVSSSIIGALIFPVNALGGAVVAAIGTGGSAKFSSEMKLCNQYQGQVYLRFNLASGSWTNSLRNLPFDGPVKAFALIPSYSCK